MKILFVSSEVAPFSKTGGLGDVCAALPRHLVERGHDVLLITPLHTRAFRETPALELVPEAAGLSVQIGPHTVRFSIFRGALPGSNVPVHFVACNELYARADLYTTDADEHFRYIALCYIALTTAQHLGFSPDVAHVNDWQGALLPLILRCRYAWDTARFGKTKTLLTIHNIAHQGAFSAHALADTGLADSAHLFHQEQLHAGVVNLLLTGILYADGVNTVSPTYAREIQGPELGMGLDPFLRARSSSVVGILNGIDPGEWSPETDDKLPHRYSRRDLEGKERNKKALLESLGLPYSTRVPVCGVVCRLSAQKGIDLILEAMPGFLARGLCQLVVLGSGSSNYEGALAALERRFPRHVCFYRGFSDTLAHRIEAGADLFLMPSRFEPCGLNQMYSLAYGTPPIVRKTGGLADSVSHFDRRTGRGNGFVFDHYSADGLRWALAEALRVWPDRESWRRLQDNGMREDFSWSRRIGTYEAVYRRLEEL